MLTLNQTSGNNSATIWVIKILTDTPIYLATKDISLSNTFDGQVLSYDNYLSELSQSSSIEQSGGTGQVANVGLSISRHTSNSATDGFFNEFYPATSGIYLSGVAVQFGICWEGATADTDITWLFLGRVVDYDYEQRKLNLIIFQESEITNKEVPYYEVQKENNNEVSYFLYSPDDSYGRVIPIVYGNLAQGTTTGSLSVGSGTALAPAIPVHKRLTKFLVCSHKCYETAEDNGLFANSEVIFKYLEGLQTYMLIRNETIATESSTENNFARHTLSLTNRGSSLVGAFFIRLTEQSEMSDVEDIDGATDKDITTYSELDAVAGGDNKLALKAIGTASTSEVGMLSITDTDIELNIYASSNNAFNRNYTLNYFNNTIPSPAGDSSPTTGTLSGTSSTRLFHQFATNTDGKKNADLPWTIEEICSLDFYLENNQTTVGHLIYVYYGYVYINFVKVYSPNWSRAVRQDSGRRVR